jgi:hypothetical protein
MSLEMGNVQELTRDFLMYACHVDPNAIKQQSHYVLVDEFDDLRSKICLMSVSSQNEWMPKGAPEANKPVSFFELTTLYGLWGYVENKLSQLPVESRRTEATRLLRCILPPHDIYVRYGAPLPRLKMVSLLLDFGANPNDGQARVGAWGNTLKYAAAVSAPDTVTQELVGDSIVESASPDPLVQRYISIMRLLVLSGADPYARVPGIPKDALGIVEKFLVPHYPQQSAELLDEIHKARAAVKNKRATKR